MSTILDEVVRNERAQAAAHVQAVSRRLTRTIYLGVRLGAGPLSALAPDAHVADADPVCLHAIEHDTIHVFPMDESIRAEVIGILIDAAPLPDDVRRGLVAKLSGGIIVPGR